MDEEECSPEESISKKEILLCNNAGWNREVYILKQGRKYPKVEGRGQEIDEWMKKKENAKDVLCTDSRKNEGLLMQKSEGTDEQSKGTVNTEMVGLYSDYLPPTSTIFESGRSFKQLARDEKKWHSFKKKKERIEYFTIEERAKFLHDTIAAQRKFLAQQRSEAIRNRPPTKNQLRNQMMTYLKHVGNFKHSDLKTKKFEEIQALYEKIKRSDKDFISIGYAEEKG
ncbi:hypothetical protein Tco_1549481 [Tanacetum coccineum]